MVELIFSGTGSPVKITLDTRGYTGTIFLFYPHKEKEVLVFPVSGVYIRPPQGFPDGGSQLIHDVLKSQFSCFGPAVLFLLGQRAQEQIKRFSGPLDRVLDPA